MMSKYWVDNDTLENCSIIGYMELRPESNWFPNPTGYTAIYLHALIGQSDNGTIANYEYVKAETWDKDISGVYLVGDSRHYTIGFTDAAMENEPVLSILSALEQGSLDESRVVELDNESYLESWESYGEWEFKLEIVSKFLQYHDRCEQVLDSVSSEDMRKFFQSLISSGEYYIFDSGNSCCLFIGEAVSNLTVKRLAEFIRKNR
jgi:hypothetical protein